MGPLRRGLTFVRKSLTLKIVLLLVTILTVSLACFAVYDVQNQRQAQEAVLLQKGRILARTGAQTASAIFEQALASGALTPEQLFDTAYVPIPDTKPQKFHTAYDAFTDRVFQKLEDEFLDDGDVVFAVVVDRNGYLPTHNTKFSTQATEPLLNRTKRMFDDPVGLAAARNAEPFLQQVYRRDTGETMWDLSSPILVQGKPWGAFRIGFSIQRTEAKLADLAVRTVVALLVVLALLAGVSVLLARYVGRGVGAVAAASERIAREDLPALAEAARALADGDLTKTVTLSAERVPTSGQDEIGRLGENFNAMVDRLRETGGAFEEMTANLRDLVGQVQSSANTLAGASQQVGAAAVHTDEAVQQVASAVQQAAVGAQAQAESARETTHSVSQLLQAIDQVARGAQDQASSVTGASMVTTQMAAGVEQVAANAQTVAAASQQTKASAEQGARSVAETITGMTEISRVVSQAAGKVEDLGTLGERIGAVVETIDDIAEQTNLLALNAAIEAARAGEHGKGFAVVADEVRKLAERSQRETKAIAELIKEVQSGTQHAVEAMQLGAQKVERGSAQASQAGKALETILEAVAHTVDQVTEIAAGAQEMATQGREVSAAMTNISAGVEQATAASEQMAASADEVGKSIDTIVAAAEDSSASSQHVAAATEQMRSDVQRLSAQADEVAGTADQLRALVARFRLGHEDQSATAPARLTLVTGGSAQPIRR